MFKTFNHPFVVDALTFIIFGKYYTNQLSNYLFEPVPCLISYDKTWKFKGFWDSHEDKIRDYCLRTYGNFNNKKLKLDKPANSLDNFVNKIDTSLIFGITNNVYEREIEKV